jgi:hypothetical protein
VSGGGGIPAINILGISNCHAKRYLACDSTLGK